MRKIPTLFKRVYNIVSKYCFIILSVAVLYSWG